jgi:probable rRNA maturation factor
VDPASKRGRRSSARGANGSALRVTVTDGAGHPIRDGGLARWLETVAPSAARGEVAIALVSDAHSQKLNSHYRKKNAPTDVLSFPSTGSRIPNPGLRHRSPLLGDIVIATGTARKQARDAGHSYHAELRVLALHGLLHLLGYDHDTADDRGRMARVETRLRRRGGLRTGLIERS